MIPIEVFRELYRSFKNKISEELFFKILQAPLFSGGAVAEYFKDFKLELTQTLQESSSAPLEFFKTSAVSLSSTKLVELVEDRPKRSRDDIPEDASKTKRFKESEVIAINEEHKVKLSEEDDTVAEKSSEDKPKAIFPSN